MSDDVPVHLRRILTSDAEKPPEETPDLPANVAGEYSPYALPSPKPLFAVHFVATNGDIRSFQYLHLDSNSSFVGQRIVLRFLGMQAIQVTIDGRNLRALYEYLHQHRMRWVQEAARDFARDGEPVVSKITIGRCDNVD